jgi:Fe-S cluster assembly iron-binding protein IscA
MMIQITEKAQTQVDEFFNRNADAARSIRIFLQEGG